MSSADHPIAIIGAGVSGLSCAAHLQAAGHTVHILEQAPWAGGRVSTWRGEDWQCDYGAQYFTARDARFVTAVEGWQAAGVIARWEPRVVAFDGTRLTPAGDTEARWTGCPDMAAFARHLAKGLSVRTGTRVRALGREGDDWIFDIDQGGVLEQRYAAVLVTLPAPQAHGLLVEASPGFAGIAAETPMRGCWALLARFHDDPRLPFDAAFVNSGPLSWVARDSSKPGRSQAHVWVLHAPAADLTNETTPAERAAIADAMIEAFAELGAPRPDAWTLRYWPHAMNVSPSNVGSLWDPDARLGLAGDWLMGGRVEGAWLSGHQLAEVVLASMPATSKSPGSPAHTPAEL